MKAFVGELEYNKRFPVSLLNLFILYHLKFIITCGGFLQFKMPKSIHNKNIKEIRQNESKYTNVLSNEARGHIVKIFNRNILSKLSRISDYISLGIDSQKEKISIVQNYIKETHIELVFLIDLRCHDLSIFNNRSWKTTGDIRKNFKIKFRNLAKQEKPTYVLHHPHSTVKVRTWLNSWSNLIKILPSVKSYAGADKFYENDSDPSKWDEIYKVLKYNKLGNSIDYIRNKG